VNVSLGSDGSCSPVSVSMLNVVGAAAALSKLRGDDPAAWLTAREALAAGTQGSARALGFGGRLGVIERGAIADLVAYRLDTISFTPLNDPVRQLVYTERGAGLDCSRVAGDVVLRDSRLTRVDEPRLLAEIEAEFRGLEARYAAAEGSVAPVRAAMEAIYQRTLDTAVPARHIPGPASGLVGVSTVCFRRTRPGSRLGTWRPQSG
jgi:guanine deaminase